MKKINVIPNLTPILYSIKQKLLDTNYFIDNEYLQKYIDIFSIPLNNSDRLEGHHILPKSYFAMTTKIVDNSPSNLRTITFKNHYLAHYYLTLCTKGLLKEKATLHFNRLNNLVTPNIPEIMSVQYEKYRTDNAVNYISYIKTAHNNINEYNKKFTKRPKSHVDKIQETKRKNKLKKDL